MAYRKRLAKTELLVERITKDLPERYAGTFTNMHLEGVYHYAGQAVEKYRVAKRLLARDEKQLEASKAVSELAHALKNLADNLNRGLQGVYNPSDAGDREYIADDGVSLSRLIENTKDAPLLPDGRTIAEEYFRVHQPRGGQLQWLRNAEGHGKAHCTLKVVEDGYELPDGECATKWADRQMQAYMALTEDVLRTIAKSILPAAEQEPSDARVRMRQIKNYLKEYQTPALVGLTAIGVTAGVAGTVAYQTHEQKMLEQDRRRQLESLIYLQQAFPTDRTVQMIVRDDIQGVMRQYADSSSSDSVASCYSALRTVAPILHRK